MASTPEARWSFSGGLLTRWKLRRCARVGAGTMARGRIWVHGRGAVKIGKGVVLDGSHHPIELHALERDAVIEIGDGARIEGGASIEAVMSVTVGADTRIGSFARVMDNHFHPLVGDRHWRPPSSPVRVGAKVEIGARAILLAGAQVEDHATVRAGTVLTRKTRVPAGRTACGAPAVVQ
jgi:acetyltransferase-like isoleucine patch superfamily enzyme